MMKLRLVSMLMCTSIASTGCSRFLVDGPPSVPAIDASTGQPKQPECTTSKTVPFVDLGVGAGLVGIGAIFLAASSGDDCSSMDCEDAEETALTVGLVSVGVGLLATVAGIGGFSRVSECREQRREFALAQHGPTPSQPPRPVAGCTKDTDCKGDRLCDAGTCRSPSGPSPSSLPEPPASSPQSTP